LLSYDTPAHDENVAREFMDNRKRISISGVQEKLSFLLEKNELRLYQARRAWNIYFETNPQGCQVY